MLCGITHSDTTLDVENLVPKLLKLKLWSSPDGSKPWATNIVENNFQILLVSQFTLYYTLKGQKPDFHGAMPGDEAKKLYDYFLSKLAAEYHNA